MENYFKPNDTFIIAEVGQNHNGKLELAIEYIRRFSACGADAIKFQTRSNKYLFSKKAYDKTYNSENSFGKTYGEHRDKLELKPEWLPILKSECIENGVKFMSTPFDEPSLDLLRNVGVDILKVASFDLGNLPFINKIAATKIPVVMSIGGGNLDQIKSSIDLILSYHKNLSVLHCVSEYPTSFDRLGLNNIKTLIDKFPGCTIGISDHFNGILSGPISYMIGARVFEKHVTLDRSNKGTDHSFALEPTGFTKFTRDIRRVGKMLPPKDSIELGDEPVFKKLGKSLITNKNIKPGHKISIDDLSGKIFDKQYIPVRESNQVINKTAIKELKKGEPILYNMIT